MVRAKNYRPMSTFVKVMQKNRGLFLPDTVYYHIAGIFMYSFSAFKKFILFILACSI